MKEGIHMDATMWNVGSIFLALAAWIFPVAGLLRSLKRKDPKELLWSVASFAACGMSLCMQLYYQEHLVAIEDWSALLDTADTAAALGRNMVLFTLAANLLLIWRIFRKERR